MASAAWEPVQPNESVRRFNTNLPSGALSAFSGFAMNTAETTRAKGEAIFSVTETPKHVFVLMSGRIKITISSRQGKTAILRVAGPGEVLGLSAAMSGLPYETSAEAIELCRLQAIPVNDFLGFVQRHPEAAAEITPFLLREYRYIFNSVCRLALPNTVAGRLASLLLEWADIHGSHTNERRFILAVTQEEIANMANTTRETVSRILHQFQQDKLISIKGASMTILEPGALQALAV